MSRRVLIAWEFGSGLGHLAAIHPVVSALRARGREPLVAVPDPERAREVLGAGAPRLIRAVPLAPPRRRPRPPESFSDLLLQRGFSSEMLLERAVRGWHDIYRVERIESVLLDYAPVAQLAAWTMSIPMTAYGVSFANPPLPIPCFRPEDPSSGRLARASEQRLAMASNAVARRFGRRSDASLASWLHAPRSFIRGIPETAVYEHEPGGGYVGPMGSLPLLQQLEWRGCRRQRVLCYLRWTSQLSQTIAALVHPERELICVVPGAPHDWCTSPNQADVLVAAHPVNIPDLIAGSDLVISHGSANVACEALIAGKPQIVYPIDCEKMLISRKLASLGVARIAGVARAPAADLLEAESVSTMRAAAESIASKVERDSWRENFSNMIDGI